MSERQPSSAQLHSDNLERPSDDEVDALDPMLAVLERLERDAALLEVAHLELVDRCVFDHIGGPCDCDVTLVAALGSSSDNLRAVDPDNDELPVGLAELELRYAWGDR